MKYVIPIAIEQADAVKLLGTLPQTATQTRNALANVVADLVRKQASQRDAGTEPSARKREPGSSAGALVAELIEEKTTSASALDRNIAPERVDADDADPARSSSPPDGRASDSSKRAQTKKTSKKTAK